MIKVAQTPHHEEQSSSQNKQLIEFQQQIYLDTIMAEIPHGHLMGWLLDHRNLIAAWGRVSNSDGADTPGVDQLTCRSVKPQLSEWLQKISDDIYHGTYEPMAIRWILIPKSKPGQFRQLGIMTVRDRVVHAAIKQVLEPILEPRMVPQSYGFRPGRSVASALADAVQILDSGERINRPMTFAASLDIENCFDTIDNQLLIEQLRTLISDDDLMSLLQKLLNSGATTATSRFWRTRQRGLIQGSSLSPLLCNFYLDRLDRDLLQYSDLNEHATQMLRYADNLLLLAEDASSAKSGISTIHKSLGKLYQKLGVRRPTAVPIQQGIDWLGVTLRPRIFKIENHLSFGYSIPASKVQNMVDRLSEMTALPSEKIDAAVFNLEKWIVAINQQLRQWRQSYLYADNAFEVFRTLDDYARLRFGKLLSHLTGERMASIRTKYRVRLPRGFWSWQVNGVRMSVLSSLAPHIPNNLKFKPPWMVSKPRRKQQLPILSSGVSELQDHASLEAETETNDDDSVQLEINDLE
ncbi:MAG: reverse transcriptase domain-containing protein [Zavarzinella sp.]